MSKGWLVVGWLDHSYSHTDSDSDADANAE